MSHNLTTIGSLNAGQAYGIHAKPMHRGDKHLPPSGRSFTQFTDAATQRVDLTDDIVLTGDYKITGTIYFTGIESFIYGWATNANNRVKITSGGVISWRPIDSTTEIATSSGAIQEDVLSTVSVERIGTQGIIRVNGAVVLDATVLAGTGTVNRIGAASSNHSTCILSDISIIDDGTVVLNMPLDEPHFTNSSNGLVGPELFFASKATNADANVTIANGVITKSTSSGSGGMDFGTDHGLTDGQLCRVEFTYSNETGSDLALVSVDSCFGGNPTALRSRQGAGNYAEVLPVTDDTKPLRFAWSNSGGDISNVSVKREIEAVRPAVDTLVARNTFLPVALPRYRFGFDAGDDYLDIPDMDLVSGDTVEFKFIAPIGSTGLLAFLMDAGVDTDVRAFVYRNVTSDLIRLNGSVSTLTMDGVDVTHDVTPFPSDGLEHTMVLTMTAAAVVGRFGARSSNALNQYNDPIYDIVIKNSGGTILRSYAVGGNGATVIDAIGTRRYKYLFDGVDDFIQIPDVNLVSGDTVEFKYIAPTVTSGNTRHMADDNGNIDRMHFKMTAADVFTFRDGSMTATIDGNAITDGVTASPLDGLEHTIILTATSTMIIGRFGARYDGNFPADFPIYDIVITAANHEDRAYTVDDNSSTIVDNLSTGTDILTNGDFTSGSTGWTLSGSPVFANNQVTLETTGAFEAIDQVMPIAVGNTITIRIDIESLDEGSIRVGDSLDAPYIDISEPGIYEVTATATTDTIRIKRSGTPLNAVINSISVINNTNGTVINHDPASWFHNALTDGTIINHVQGNWDYETLAGPAEGATPLGPELHTNHVPSSVGSPWVDNGDGSFTIDGTQTGTVSVAFTSLPAVIGESYLITFTVDQLTAGRARARIGNNSPAFDGDVGLKETLHTATSVQELRLQADLDFKGTITIGSVKKVIGYGDYLNVTPADADLFVIDTATLPNNWIGVEDLWTLGEITLADGVTSATNGVTASEYRVTKSVDFDVFKEGGGTIGLGVPVIDGSFQFLAVRNPTGGNTATITNTPTVKRRLEIS